MKIPTANDNCARIIEEWIHTVAHLPERHNIDAWLTQAEQSACNTPNGYQINIEMQRIATASGKPEVLDIPHNCFDWLTIKE